MKLDVLQIFVPRSRPPRQRRARPERVEPRRIGRMLVDAPQSARREDHASRCGEGGPGQRPTIHHVRPDAHPFPRGGMNLHGQIGHHRLGHGGDERMIHGRAGNALRDGLARMIGPVDDPGGGMTRLEAQTQTSAILSIEGNVGERTVGRVVQQQFLDPIGTLPGDLPHGLVDAQSRAGAMDVGAQTLGTVSARRVRVAIDDAPLGPVRIAIGRDASGEEEGDGDAVSFGGDEGRGASGDSGSYHEETIVRIGGDGRRRRRRRRRRR
mmetsp:Transcript_17127/g.49514  ORF Transcript_17127/g.49514 Transcript_17127/m.49514 type:complete len:267 (+) Transcript_17127:1311-2111(+)